MTQGVSTRCWNQTAIRRAREIRYSALDLTGVAHIDWNHLHPERRRYGLYRSELGKLGGIGRIPKNSHPGHVRRDLFEQLQPRPGWCGSPEAMAARWNRRWLR